MKIYEESMLDEHNYSIDDGGMVVEYDPTKLDAKKRDPFTMIRVFPIRTVRLQIGSHI